MTLIFVASLNENVNLANIIKDKLENKGKDREEIDFFGKFILISLFKLPIKITLLLS